MVTALVLAAGRSSRMGGAENKQFIELNGKPLLWYSLNAFQNCRAVANILLVRRSENAVRIEEIAGEFPKVVGFADGGAERQNSVWSGLQKATGEIVAVHDGARPLVTPALIEATIASAQQHGTGIAATKVVDTLKEANADRTVSRTVDRAKIWAVQTPQTARADWLRQAYRFVLETGRIVTDEAAAIEALGYPVHLVETPFLNLKVTTPDHVPVAAALLRAQ